MKRGPLLKYQVGLIVIGLFTLVVVGIVLMQASATSHDAAIDKQANQAADKLTSYVQQKQSIPSSLSEAGYSDDSPAISYTKLSDTSYKFCVTYKADSSNFDATSAVTTLATGGSVDPSSSYNSGSDAYLFIPPTHHKGSNCQTITPYIAGGSGYNSYQPDITVSPSYGIGGLQTKAEDTKRQTDINSLYSHIEAAYANNGAYPTLSELNDSTWRATNMKGLDPTALCDPSATTKSNCQLAASPQKGSYSYSTTDSSGSNCTTSGDCQYYAVTATLSTGKVYSKSYTETAQL